MGASVSESDIPVFTQDSLVQVNCRIDTPDSNLILIYLFPTRELFLVDFSFFDPDLEVRASRCGSVWCVVGSPR